LPSRIVLPPVSIYEHWCRGWLDAEIDLAADSASMVKKPWCATAVRADTFSTLPVPLAANVL